ncbi:nuclear transport factor 2 family protein [Aquimarina algiphila]|uniref:nuclear transport factor 2 family protein n=1 Tax=Aquimarina algiphila TaxID=2047982 RepID=UPI00232ABBFE|nr:nuclear transport factor 2 family protein [Aquimarina algiphila]
MNKEHPNIEVLKRLDLTNLVASTEVIAEDFVWHYFNPELPDLEGDYFGLSGLMAFFKKLSDLTTGIFKINPLSITPMGDEIVVVHVKDTMLLKGNQMEVDAVVVWSIFDGLIKEAWDIPAVRTATVIKS